MQMLAAYILIFNRPERVHACVDCPAIKRCGEHQKKSTRSCKEAVGWGARPRLPKKRKAIHDFCRVTADGYTQQRQERRDRIDPNERNENRILSHFSHSPLLSCDNTPHPLVQAWTSLLLLLRIRIRPVFLLFFIFLILIIRLREKE